MPKFLRMSSNLSPNFKRKVQERQINLTPGDLKSTFTPFNLDTHSAQEDYNIPSEIINDKQGGLVDKFRKIKQEQMAAFQDKKPEFLTKARELVIKKKSLKFGSSKKKIS